MCDSSTFTWSPPTNIFRVFSELSLALASSGCMYSLTSSIRLLIVCSSSRMLTLTGSLNVTIANRFGCFLSEVLIRLIERMRAYCLK